MLIPKISVIIPVYNAQDYLERCLNSVCNQTLKEIEIICINDCSLDNSINILIKYFKKFSNLKIIDCKNNGGESIARNIGIDNSKGEYIAFVDNDDDIDIDFYEKLYDKAKKTNADIVKGNLKEIGYNGELHEGQLNPKIVQTGNKWHFRYEWWCAIYKRSLVIENKIRLPEGFILGGDCLFLHYAIEKCNKLVLVNDCFYYWRRRRNSGESEILSIEKVKSALKIFDIILANSNRLLKENKINDISYEILFNSCIWIPLNYIFRNNINESKMECIKYALKFYNKCLLSNVKDRYIKSEFALFYDCFVNNDPNKIFREITKFNNKKEFESKNLLAKLRLRIKSEE